MSILARLGLCAALTMVVGAGIHTSLRAQGAAPRYEIDMTWPKPLPNSWVLGGLGGTCVDARDHLFILNRQDVLEGELNAGNLAPPIIEVDPAGNVVNSWGDANLLDSRLHSCHVDKDGNIWIASAPSGMVQKYTRDGSKLLLQLGKKGVFDSSDGTVKGTPLNSNAAQFFMPSSIYVDPQNGDVYVSDGESRGGNKRIAVMDRDGKFLRQWQPEGMETVHCMTMAKDGQGSLKKTIEVPWTPVTAPAGGKPKQSGGATVAIDFSRDGEQRLMFVVNQNNSQIEVLDRETGKKLSSFGRVGRYPGQFDQAHGIAVDSKSNVYIAENRGRKIQRFKPVTQ
jgi:sugar lactone lactonase YvrE